MLSLSTHQLTIFLAAAETLNFTQAAQRLQITQPSISQNIQALEEHFGLPLFTRTGRNICLSEAGKVLVPLASELLYLAGHIEETMASMKGDVQGHLVVGCSTPTGRYLLPKLLASFHHQFPHVRVTCQVDAQPKTLEMLMDGKVHMALANAPPPCQDIEFRKLMCETLVLIAPVDHPWAQKGEINLAELPQADFILPVESSDTYSVLREALEEQDFSIFQLRTLVTLGSLEAIALAVQEGLGVGFVPELLAARLVQGRVALVKVQGLEIQCDVCVGRNLRRPATAAQTEFWEYLCKLEGQLEGQAVQTADWLGWPGKVR